MTHLVDPIQDLHEREEAQRRAWRVAKAAPDMYHSLKNIRDILRGVALAGPRAKPTVNELEQMWFDVDAALSIAEGK